MLEVLKKFWRVLYGHRGPHWIRTELRYVSYQAAERLLKDNTADAMWRVAREEDRNRVIGMVYLEFVVKVSGHARA